ncbi:ImmA/IrrE family metallo-endopeptidase [Glutamicibacter sp. FBE19]|uniref:ImmA/IrrE family metallo-endopeptidase n=1 Tax=Glutamicibacter sp. FBE19 TaxID=2761534 RepID=UPI0018969DE0|nr:ImmA/IrrE family metallo-endopeptidase [Glutamicibacter sp. FBE19]MBF6672459.1 ImmA/IrrE family metallo-endopeptidase [Glutamicibacter sp. FBE19]
MSAHNDLLPVQESPLSTTAIRQYAEKIAEHHDLFGEGYQADLHALVLKLGGTIDVSSKLLGDESLTVNSASDFTIHLPPLTSERRDRFTIAHELGHYFLHYLQPSLDGKFRFGRGRRNRAETQANYFAASLLMPESKFRDAYIEYSGDDWAIADAFGVSPQAVNVRAQSLGLK